MNSTPLHGDLRLEWRFSAIVGGIALLAGSFLLFWAAALSAILTGGLRSVVTLDIPPPLIGWLVVFACLMAGLTLLLFGRSLLLVYPRSLRKVSWLLAFTQPRSMAVALDPQSGRRAELRDPGRAASSEPAMRVALRSPHWKLKGLEPQTVDVYCEPGEEGMIVLRTNRGILWGICERADLHRPIS